MAPLVDTQIQAFILIVRRYDLALNAFLMNTQNHITAA